MARSHFPRTMAFSYHLKLFVRARWLAIAMSLLGVSASQFFFELSFVYSWLYSIIGVMALYNLGFWYVLRGVDFHESQLCVSPECQEGWRMGRYIAWMQILFDLVALFSLLHFTGGLENPFVIFFMLHMVMATILLEPLGTALVALVITTFVFFLGFAEHLGVLGHYHQHKIYGDFEPINHPLFILGIPSIIFVMNACLTALTFFMMRAINGRRDTIINLSRELEDNNNKLILLDNRRKQTMAVASHDMKAPIDAVSSYLIMMQDGYLGEFTEKQMAVIQKSHQRLKRLRQFVSDVLDWQTIERGEVQQQMGPTQVIDVIRDVVNAHDDAAKKNNVQLLLRADGTFPTVVGDARRLYQVFDNLISNAVKYTLDGGRVEVIATVNKENVAVRIADTGIGMDDEELSHLFEDFYRSPKVKKKFDGTGLGLSVVERIVRAHHGRVWAESKPGEGTTFHVSIPIGRLSKPPRG